ncbi:MAG: hypothetical protein PHS62_01755 [Patescibacteria group bacterium]|nr:hypothetical protein [Patescibacteria group bacterium]
MLSDIYKIIRRRLIYVFAPWYILRQLKLRQSSCGDCTYCCDKKILWFKCKYFKDGRCGVYKTKKMPTLCWIYPIDKKDIWHNDKCKFWE